MNFHRIREQKILSWSETIYLTVYRWENPQSQYNRGQTEEEGGNHWAVFKTQRRRKNRDTGRGSGSWLLWDFLPPSLQIPLLWWWKQFVLTRSEAWLLVCPLLTSLTLSLSSPPPTLPLLSLSFLCPAQSLRATICPQPQPGEREEGNSTLSDLLLLVVLVVLGVLGVLLL